MLSNAEERALDAFVLGEMGAGLGMTKRQIRQAAIDAKLIEPTDVGAWHIDCAINRLRYRCAIRFSHARARWQVQA